MSYTLNLPVVKQLVAKDWYLQRKFIVLYTLAGIAALSFISLGEWQFVMGSTLLMSAVIGMGNHQISSTIINERKEYTLPFIMSLPVTPVDYALAKLIACMTLFVFPWLLIVAATIFVFSASPIPDGLLPLCLILALYFLLSYCLTWATGMISESDGMVLFVMIFLNCMIGPMIYMVARIESIRTHLFSSQAVWSSEALGIIAVQLSVLAVALLVAFVWQARKETFL
jgi:ABC-2 type transport system permease protein